MIHGGGVISLGRLSPLILTNDMLLSEFIVCQERSVMNEYTLIL